MRLRLRKEKGVSVRIKGALQATRDPNVPNNNTGIILSIIPVITSVIYIQNIHFGFFSEKCFIVLEETWSKRHGLIHFRSIKIAHSGIVSMNPI
jgi:hypothetical protein